MSLPKEKKPVNFLSITSDEAGQRIDNYLFAKLKSVPKTHIYKIIRKGEVRVNKKRVNAFYKLLAGDVIRLPPLLLERQAAITPPSAQTELKLKSRIIFEDDNFIILNKPSGMSVHAGSTVRVGIIESMKQLYPKIPQLELVHRLDAETSGCLVLAKRKSVLREMHQLLREGKIKKIYWTLTKGFWKTKDLDVDLSLNKEFSAGGKHVVKVQTSGKTARTVFKPLEVLDQASLMQAKLHTGRTHQIRVHAAALGHPIAADDRYGDIEFNKLARKKGVRRLFLHAYSIDFTLPSSGQHIKVVAPLDNDLADTLKLWRKNEQPA